MAIREVVKIGDSLLRKKSREVTMFDERLAQLLDDMAESMSSLNGVGLAAPQVGVLRRVMITKFDDKVEEFINPVITDVHGAITEIEGCLSVPGRSGEVERPQKLTVKAQDRYGNQRILTAEGMFARIICHETDHLDGVLFIDKAINMTDEEDD